MSTTIVDETGAIVETIPLEVKTTTPTPVPEPPKADRGETSYLVLISAKTLGGDSGSDAWEVVSTQTARSAEAAIRQHVEGPTAPSGLLPSAGGTFVAVPARSWKPVVVRPQTVTTLIFEEA